MRRWFESPCPSAVDRSRTCHTSDPQTTAASLATEPFPLWPEPMVSPPRTLATTSAQLHLYDGTSRTSSRGSEQHLARRLLPVRQLFRAMTAREALQQLRKRQSRWVEAWKELSRTG